MVTIKTDIHVLTTIFGGYNNSDLATTTTDIQALATITIDRQALATDMFEGYSNIHGYHNNR